MTTFLNNTLRVLMTASLIASNGFSLGAFAQEQGDMPQAQETISIVIGEVQPIETKNLTRVAVTNPDIVDISDAKTDQIFIAGKKSGQTELFIWDDNGKRSVIIQVASENMDVLKTRIQEVLDKTQIKGVSLEKNLYEGKIVLYGAILKADKDLLDRVMDPYSGKIINFVKAEINEELVQVDMQIIEVNTSYEKNLGIDWGTTTNNAIDDAGVRLNYLESQPGFDGSVGDFFKIGNFSRGTGLSAQVNALLREGKARVLSKPRVVVISGKQASFLVGGEIPIKSQTLNQGGTSISENTTFKQYGVNLTVTPTIKEDKINLLLLVDVTDIDASRSTVTDVAFVKRQAQTELFLDNHQTIVLAGLIKHTDNESVKKVPYLSRIPILGHLFTNRSISPANSDTEMVIILTPSILTIKKLAIDQTVIPSRRADSLVKEVEAGFDREALKSAPPKEEVKKVIETTKTIIKTEVKPPIVMSTTKVPDMMLTSYARDVQLKISKAIAYPYMAMEKNWEGTVKIRLRILRDGTLADIDVLESSGHDVFDADAISTTKSLSPFLAFPQEMTQKDLVVTVPIVYNQRTNSPQGTQTVTAAY